MNNLCGKILITGKLITGSALHIGSGGEENSDSDIQRDRNGNPVIPATSFVGALRHHFAHLEQLEKRLREFWGYMEPRINSREVQSADGNQSRLRCSNLKLVGNKADVEIREGVKIDSKKATAEDKGKYSLEVLAAGYEFELKLEMSYTGKDADFTKQIARTIFAELKSGITLGAKSNNGFGEVYLLEGSSNIYHYDFRRNRQDVKRWLISPDPAQENRIAIENLDSEFGQCLSIRPEPIHVKADFLLKTSLLSRSYSANPQDPDTTHIKSGNQYVLPGSSIKGALRARAERIIHTLNLPGNFISLLFGNIDKESKGRAIRGKIRIRESVLPAFVEELQTRIKIDRFTGGTIHSALLESMPLFVDFSEKLIRLDINIDPRFDKAAEALGLVLLVLKDLWSGDLALGGEKSIGRGVLRGKRAEIQVNGETIILTNETAMSEAAVADREKLEAFVAALLQLQPKKEAV